MCRELKENYVAFQDLEHGFYKLKIGVNAPLRENPENYELTARKIKNAMHLLHGLYRSLFIEMDVERILKEVMENDKV